jgi:hypothetical protein
VRSSSGSSRDMRSSLFGLRTAREFPLRRLAFGCCDAIGLLMLHSGRHPSAHQIVPESWIRESTSPRVTAFKENNCVIKYGYFWWLGTGCRTSPVGQPKEVRFGSVASLRAPCGTGSDTARSYYRKSQSKPDFHRRVTESWEGSGSGTSRSRLIACSETPTP